MTTYYTLKSGNKISVFMWEDFFENEVWRKNAEVRVFKDGKWSEKEKKAKLFTDSNGLYIVWESQKVYLNDFDYLSYSDMVDKVNQGVKTNDRWFVSEDELLATFMKESEKVAVVCELPAYDVLIPSMGIGLTGDKYVEVLCVLSENRYKKNSWDYKITLIPENENIRLCVASRDFYFSDFKSLLMSGNMKLVNKEEYLAEKEVQRSQKENENRKFVNRVKNIFKKEENKIASFPMIVDI